MRTSQVSDVTKGSPPQTTSTKYVNCAVTPSHQETKELIKVCECHQLKAELASLKLALQNLQQTTQEKTDAQEDKIKDLKTEVARL